MDGVQSLILGAIQGLTEFIPVSSSGHLVIGQYFMVGSSSHQFLEFINIGTLAALIVYFRHKIAGLIKGAIEQKSYSLLRNIVITSLPAGVTGILLAGLISTAPFFGSVIVVIVTLATVGVLMIILERLPHMSPVDGGDSLTWKRALIIGIAQIFALIPGVSRSGSTIIAGRIVGLRHADAAEYSFLASLPIMIAVTLKLLVGSSDRIYLVENIGLLIIGNVAAFFAGIIAIKFLLAYLSKHDLKIFGWYRICLAGLATVLLLLQ
ncbi:undecaprenyl-diphosphate phosphatase [Candidatus Saccharibacteria bacterium]|nr:undecaprenyl-diphosphate phosphatase [Candidatus Saccharibacteria bacterium]